jgi:hypothetical protein
MKALGGSAASSPADGNKLAGEWREARGILRTIAEIRTRLKRMDEDETKLHEGVSRTARQLDIDVAEDGVAGARMLQTRWTENDKLRTKRDELKEEHEVGKVRAETAAEAVKVAGEIDDEELVRAMQEALSLGRLTTPTPQRFLRAIKIARRFESDDLL